MEFNHVSVLLEETIDSLSIKSDGIYVDGTLGGAGHSEQICKRLSKNGRLIGIDQDAEAIETATERLKPYGNIVTIVKSNYVNIKSVLDGLGIDKVDGIVLDLGVSSYQFDNYERGFSYREDAPLDMRMDKDAVVSAKDIVNNYSEEALFEIIKNYGEERYAKSIAKNIVKERQKHELLTTFELVDVIRQSVPAKYRNAKGHPAKRTFQAIRIECNKELEVLESALDDMVELLNPLGVISIITFHSLEDRIVKNRFRTWENPCTCPPNFPVCVCGKKPRGKMLKRKPVLPSEKEIEDNKRSKSAKLRSFIKSDE